MVQAIPRRNERLTQRTRRCPPCLVDAFGIGAARHRGYVQRSLGYSAVRIALRFRVYRTSWSVPPGRSSVLVAPSGCQPAAA